MKVIFLKDVKGKGKKEKLKTLRTDMQTISFLNKGLPLRQRRQTSRL